MMLRAVSLVVAMLALQAPAIALDQSLPHPDIYRLETAQVSCQPRRTCKQIGSCDEARWYLYNCSWGGRLDGDNDGAPCEQLCGSNN
jgi:hypothetical protein